MQISTAPFYTVEDFRSLHEFEAVIPAGELDEVDALGDTHDDVRWGIGDKARMWADELNLPAMWVCICISSRSDFGKTSVRHFLYVSRFYFYTDLRDYYHSLRYGIFKYASRLDNAEKAEECLLYAFENRLKRPGELKELFPAKELDLSEEQVRIELSIPLWARPISRRIFELDPDQRKRAEAILTTLLGILQGKETNSAGIIKEDAIKLYNKPTGSG